MKAREIQDKFLDDIGVAIISGTSFGIHGDDYVRFSYAASIESIREACSRIRDYLE